jgi:hypothetical protein
MTDWQPIETAPKDGTMVLLYKQSSGTKGSGYWDDRENFWRIGAMCYFNGATHWAPYPAVPHV